MEKELYLKKMKITFITGLILLTGFGLSVFSNTPGESDSLVKGTIISFRTNGEHQVAYHVYTPTNFDPLAPPPMVLAFSSGGFGHRLLENFVDAAEAMGWIGIGCDSLQNNMVVSDTIEHEMEDELLNEILQSIPHNAERVYLTGGSGGAMRSYGLTLRHPELFAGVIAHGGWLGGPDYQDFPYPKGKHIAMLNGNRDMGAGAWTVQDTKTLRGRSCSVKHFTCLGGHMVAPADLTLIAFNWLEEQWRFQDIPEDSKVRLEVLYVGNDPDRTDDFVGFLSKSFHVVSSVSSDYLTLAMCNKADILVLDEAVYTLPDNYNKAMIMVGPSALATGQRYGSKMVIEGEISENTLLVSMKSFVDAEDSEILLEGFSGDGKKGALRVREASRLLWGEGTSPAEMKAENRDSFIQALLWIHDFDGLRQSVSGVATPRDSIMPLIDMLDIVSKEAMRWFPEEVLKECTYDKQKLKAYYKENMPYVSTDFGSGQLRVDEAARDFGTPNNEVESILEWINIFENNGWPDRWHARNLMARYASRYSRGAGDWRQWYEENRNSLYFSDEEGYHFMIK